MNVDNIVIVDNMSSYELALRQFTELEDLRRVYNEVKLNITSEKTSFFLRGKQYELRGECLEYIIDDLDLLLARCTYRTEYRSRIC